MSALAAVKKHSRMLIAGFALSLAFSSSALALDGKAFVDSLQDGMKPYGLTLQNDGLDVKGDNLTLKNVRLLQQDDTSGMSLPIYLGTVTFDNVKQAKDGSFNVDKISSDDNAKAMAEAAAKSANKAAKSLGQITIQNMQVIHALISPKGKVYTIAQYLPYEKATIKNISYQADGKTILSLNDLSAQYKKKTDGAFQNISKIGSFVYDPAAWPGDDGKDAKELLSSLGYQNIKGSIDASGIWNPKSGDLNIDEYKLTADNMGSLSLKGKISGITQDFANAYQKLALQQMETKNPTDAQMQQMSQEAIALTGQLNVNNLSLTYKDNSLMGKILDYMSQGTGEPRQEMVSVLKAGVLANTQNFQNTEFAAHVAAQINAFLDNPQSLQITAQPKTPVAFSSVLLALGISPEQLINLLGLDVTANK